MENSKAVEVLQQCLINTKHRDFNNDWEKEVLTNALEEALLALEEKDRLVDLFLELANNKADDIVTGNEIISCLEKSGVKLIQGEGFVWKRSMS